MWSLQIHALLDGYALTGHLDGSIFAPSATVIVGDTTYANPAFILWKRQDKLIYIVLLRLDFYLASAHSLKNNHDISDMAHAGLHLCKAKLWPYQTTEDTTQKLDQGNQDYWRISARSYNKVGSTRYSWKSSWPSRSDRIGLPEEYKSVVDQVEGIDVYSTITELHERIINHEAKILSAIPAASSPFPISANVVQHRNRNQNNNNNTNRYHSENKQRYNNNNNNNNNLAATSKIQ